LPDIGEFHPQIVHFVIALLFVGVGARVLSLLPLPARFGFLSPAAAALIILGSVASVAAAWSGDDAHDPVERVPGARPAVQAHERWGERTRNVFIAVGLLEIVGLALGARAAARGVRAVSALAGLAGLAVLYEAGEHGGDLVYEYAGGVGIHSGDTTDVTRLLVAGLYHAALKERAAGRPEQAARLMAELGRQMPGDTNVRFLLIESTFRDSKDPAAALTALDAVQVAPGDRRLEQRVTLLRADALVASGRKDSARALIQALVAQAPNDPRLKQRLEAMK
jgi:uncharacterized membrane protein